MRSFDGAEFELLDRDFDPGISVAKGPDGTMYFQSNTPDGRCVNSLRMHPRIAEKLRDWLVLRYVENVR